MIRPKKLNVMTYLLRGSWQAFWRVTFFSECINAWDFYVSYTDSMKYSYEIWHELDIPTCTDLLTDGVIALDVLLLAPANT